MICSQESVDSGPDLIKSVDLSALRSAKLINMQKCHTKRCMILKVRCITMMEGRSFRSSYPISTLSLVAFLANRTLGKGQETASMTPGERSSLKFLASLPLKSLSICCLRTYPDCSTMTEAGRLKRSSIRWKNWGMMSHGLCLTGQTSAQHSREKECSLSDIIERNAGAEHYLSRQFLQNLIVKTAL